MSPCAARSWSFLSPMRLKSRHPGGVALDDAHQLAVLALDAVRFRQLGDRPRDHRERGAELVRHVGEVVHLDLRQPLLLLLFLLHPFALAAHLVDAPGRFLPDAADPARQLIDARQEHETDQDVQQDRPPGSVPGRQHPDVQGVLGFDDALVVVGDADPELVVAGRQVRIVGVVVVPRIDPVGVVAFHHVEVVRPLQAAEVQRGEGDAEGVLVVAEDDVRIVPEFPLDGGALAGFHQDIVDLQVLEHQGNGTLLGHVQRVEPGEAVGAAEHERAVRQDAGGPFGELVSADAVFLEVIDTCRVRSSWTPRCCPGGPLRWSRCPGRGPRPPAR